MSTREMAEDVHLIRYGDAPGAAGPNGMDYEMADGLERLGWRKLPVVETAADLKLAPIHAETAEWVEERAKALTERYGDPEESHAEEDRLRLHFIYLALKTGTLGPELIAAGRALVDLSETDLTSPNRRIRWYA